MLRTLALGTVLATLTGCGAPTAKVMPFIGSFGLNGDLAIDDRMGASASSSFEDLGLGDDEATLGGLVRVGLGGAELSVSALGINYEGRGMTQGEFEIAGQVIAQDVAVDTDVDVTMARGLVTWDLIPVGGVDLGVGIGATVIDLDFRLQEVGGPNNVQTEQLVPVPLIGARAAWTWGPVDLRADVGGLIIEYGDDEATFIDGEVSASVNVYDVGDLVVGYRITRIDAEYNDEDARVVADFDLEGFYLGAQFSF